MKQIIQVDIATRKVDPAKCRTDMLALGCFSDPMELGKTARILDERLGGAIRRLTKLGDFKGAARACTVVYGNGEAAPDRILLVGLGERKKATLDTLRKAAASAANKAVNMKVKRLSLALHGAFEDKEEPAAIGKAIAEGVYLGGLRYDEYVTQTQNGRLASLYVEVVDGKQARLNRLKAGIDRGRIVGEAQSYARTLANRPANVINPPALARAAMEAARQVKNLQCTVFDERRLRTAGMGGILAVGSGSQSAPRLIVLKYKPSQKPRKGLPRVGLVGKAITFDSGGISIKPAADMDQMKLDKTGGIVVLATLKAVARMKLPIEVWGLIPSAENLPSSSSYRPGDIVTTYSGKTVEVLNTDAEGRMVLCDGLAYAAEHKCDVIIDIATLTGACMVALGPYKAGLMSNDDELSRQLQEAAEQSGESVWPLPSGDEYADEMKSKIADLRNTGSRWGGACTAAAFLRQFVGDTTWAHLDIAGMDVFTKPTEYAAEGATGFGVRLLTTYLIDRVA
jgi:leucyl aminopeptidase